MKKKIITISLICFALCAVTAVTIIAVGADIKQKGEGKPTSDSYYKDSALSSQKLYNAPDGTKTVLTYKQSTETASGNPLHFYEDAAGNQYSFDQNDELIGHHLAEGVQQPQSSTSKSDVSPTRHTEDAPATPEEQILVDRARQYATQVYGKEYFSKFSYSKMVVNEALKTSHVFFYIRYKERIITECCDVTLYDDKSIGNDDVSTFGKGIDADFDETLLQDIEIKELEQFAQQKVKEQFGNNYKSYEIENDIAVVRNDNEGFDLSIAVNVLVSANFGYERVKYIYPLG